PSEPPAASDPAWIAATVGANGTPVSGVGLHYRADPTAPYQRVAMLDDGVYGALLPVSAGPGQSVAYYVEAIALDERMPDATGRNRAVVLYALGNLYRNRDDADRAIAYYARALPVM